jgi:hypothetical protein
VKNLTDHSSKNGSGAPPASPAIPPAASPARAALAWHGTLSEMGMVVISSSLPVGPIAQTLSENGEPVGRRRWCGRFLGLRTISPGTQECSANLDIQNCEWS